jgi:magnesium transporter
VDVESRLAAAFAVAHPDIVASRLESVDPPTVADFLAELEPEVASRIIDRMRPSTAAADLATLPPALSATLLESVNLTHTASILRWSESATRDSLIARLSEPLATRIRRTLEFPAGTAGALAETNAVPASPTTTVEDLHRSVADPGVPYTYIVDDAQRLLGVVHRRAIEAADPTTPLAEIMSAAPIHVMAWTGAPVLGRHPAWRDFDVLPVVDSHGVFLGVLRHRRLRDLEARKAPAVGDRDPLSSILGIAELYWAGLTDLITLFAAGGKARQESEHDDGS